MKKFLLLSVALFTCGVLHAEGMQFVTVLSSPLGTFNQLETADPNAATTATRVNFCTARSTEGTIDLHHKDFSIQNIFLRSGTSLEGNDVKNFSSTTSLTLGNGGTITGNSLKAGVLSFWDAGSAKIKVTGTLTIGSYALARVGKADTMSLGNGTYTKGSPAENKSPNVNLSWDNNYKCHMNANGDCKSNSPDFSNSYLLKSREHFCDEAMKSKCTSSGGSYDGDTCSCSCTSPFILTNGSCTCGKQATKTENCPSGYEGVKTYKLNTSTCEYELSNNGCTKKKVTCFTGKTWKEVSNAANCDTNSATGGTWQATSYAPSGATHISSVSSTCTPGKSYVYSITYGCKLTKTNSKQGCNYKHGYWSLTCAEVQSESSCMTKNPTLNGSECWSPANPNPGGGGGGSNPGYVDIIDTPSWDTRL